MAVLKKTTTSIIEEITQKTIKDQHKAKLIQWAPVIVLVFFIILFSTACSDSFLTFYNIVTILNQLSITLLIALGLTFVTLLGSVDLSVDGVVGLTGSILSVLVLNSNNSNNFGLFGVITVILTGVLFGFISGAIHVKLKVSSFMVTFGMMAVAKGFGVMTYGGRFATIQEPLLIAIPNISFLGIPLITWISFAVLALMLIVQEKSPFGRHMYAVGTNEALTRMAGINVDNVKIKAFIWSGVCMAVAGILGALRLGRGEIDIGVGQFFPAQAAVVVGGTSMSGGKGSVLNTLVGALIITILNNGLLLLGVNTYIRSGVQGLIILVAVALTVTRSNSTSCK